MSAQRGGDRRNVHREIRVGIADRPGDAGTETFDRTLAELHLRHAAAELETPLLMRFSALEKAITFGSVKTFFDERGRRTGAFNTLYNEAAANQDRESVDVLLTEQSTEIERLHHYVALVLVADELAGDYADPRPARPSMSPTPAAC